MRRARSRSSGPFERAPRQAPRRSEPSAAPSADAAGRSTRGAGREVNQDRHAVNGSVFVVADGVGGRAAGELAAERVVAEASRSARMIGQLLRRDRDRAAGEATAALRRLPALCQEVLRAQVTREPRLSGMATTLTLALVVWPDAYVVHAGDSRCYLLRGRELALLTTDQTLADDLVAEGGLTENEAAQSPYRRVLTNCVTSGPTDVRPLIRQVRLWPGDSLLLCTDGVHGVVPDGVLARIMGSALTAADACGRLLAAVADAGGSDDATAVVARFGTA